MNELKLNILSDEESEKVNSHKLWTAVQTIAWIYTILGGGLLIIVAPLMIYIKSLPTTLSITIVFIIHSVMFFFSGLGLIMKKRWGLVLMTILSILTLFAVPVGTIFSIIIFIGINKNKDKFCK